MKRFIFYALFCLCLLLFSASSFAASEPKNSAVVAQVGGVPITVFELSRQVNRVLPLRVSFHGGVTTEKISEIKEEALRDLIERGLKVKYAIDNEISVPSAQVDNKLDEVKASFDSKKAYQDAVAEESEIQLRASIYRQFLAEKAEKIAIDEKISASEKEVRAYYEENKKTFFLPKQFRASHILIKVDPASNKDEIEELKLKAETLRERAISGDDFFDLAYYNSDDRTKFVGGDLGVFHEGQTEQAFEKALKQMKVGEISDLVRTRFGFHIIKLTQVNESRQLSYDEMKEKIKVKIEEKRKDELYREWMQDLRDKYRVVRIVQ